jgi:hypothetical protein
MPPAGLLDPVEVLEELPHQPRLAGTGVTDHRNAPGAALVCAVLARFDDRLKLALPADERCLETRRAARTASARDDA